MTFYILSLTTFVYCDRFKIYNIQILALGWNYFESKSKILKVLSILQPHSEL